MNHWPTLIAQNEEGKSNYIDLLFAEKLLPENASEEEAALLIDLLQAVQEGHLCIPCSQQRLPKEIVGIPGEEKPLIYANGHLYLYQHWNKERTAAAAAQHLLSTPPTLMFDLPPSDLSRLQPEQKKAILHAAKNSLTLITGGPGTGKTYTAGRIVQALQAFSPLKIALAAPTGKAATNLQKSIAKWCTNPVEGKTLHSLLHVGFGETATKIRADLILVDECSMVDIDLMCRLLEAVPPGGRLILLGDPNQLPPIESGALFRDLIKQYKEHVVHLTTCVRTDRTELVECAASILQGTPWKKGTHVAEYPLDESTCSQETIRKRLLEKTRSFFPYTLPSHGNSFAQFRIVCPLKKGPLGVNSLNQMYVRTLKKEAKARGVKQFAAPILIVKNAPQKNLFNGETGILVQQIEKESPQLGDFALFAKNDKEYRKIPALSLPSYEYAYCMSVHKSQGSEFDHVLLLLPKGSEKFGRSVLYTAVTRAKKQIEIWADPSTLTKTLSTTLVRRSGMSSTLHLPKANAPA